MGSQNQSTRRCTKEVKYQILYNDSQGEWSTKPIVGRTTQDRTYSGIKFKICSTIPLYSKEG